MVIYCRFFK